MIRSSPLSIQARQDTLVKRLLTPMQRRTQAEPRHKLVSLAKLAASLHEHVAKHKVDDKRQKTQ